jgi:hypothetical protein
MRDFTRALRKYGVLGGGLIALAAVAYYTRYIDRPDAIEVRDLWLLVGFEVAILSAGVSRVLEVLTTDRRAYSTEGRLSELRVMR